MVISGCDGVKVFPTINVKQRMLFFEKYFEPESGGFFPIVETVMRMIDSVQEILVTIVHAVSVTSFVIRRVFQRVRSAKQSFHFRLIGQPLKDSFFAVLGKNVRRRKDRLVTAISPSDWKKTEKRIVVPEEGLAFMSNTDEDPEGFVDLLAIILFYRNLLEQFAWNPFPFLKHGLGRQFQFIADLELCKSAELCLPMMRK